MALAECDGAAGLVRGNRLVQRAEEWWIAGRRAGVLLVNVHCDVHPDELVALGAQCRPRARDPGDGAARYGPPGTAESDGGAGHLPSASGDDEGVATWRCERDRAERERDRA